MANESSGNFTEAAVNPNVVIKVIKLIRTCFQDLERKIITPKAAPIIDGAFKVDSSNVRNCAITDSTNTFMASTGSSINNLNHSFIPLTISGIIDFPNKSLYKPTNNS